MTLWCHIAHAMRRLFGRRWREVWSAHVHHPGRRGLHRGRGGAADGGSDGGADACDDDLGTFSKCLPHDPATGRADPRELRLLQDAASRGDVELLSRVRLGMPLGTAGAARLVNPLAASAWDAQGPAPWVLGMPAPPALGSARAAADLVELYAAALLRDVPFARYTDLAPPLGAVLAALSALADFAGPRGPATGAVTPGTLMRSASVPASLAGPYLSQLWFVRVPHVGAESMPRAHRMPLTRAEAAAAGARADFLTALPAVEAAENGAPPSSGRVPLGAVARYPVTGRDLAYLVHLDWMHQFFLEAALSLAALRCPPNPGIGYGRAGGPLANQAAFATLGMPDLLDALGRAGSSALRAAWHHKWATHSMRLRPEAMAALLERRRLGLPGAECALHDDAACSPLLELVRAGLYGTWCLPQTYPEGSPAHPSYPSGHATISGACAVVLLAFFDGEWELPGGAVEPGADGTTLVPARPPHRATVWSEVWKLAANVAIGRNWGGIHYRSDAEEGIALGERIGVALLRDLALRYREPHVSFTVRLSSGDTVRIGAYRA